MWGGGGVCQLYLTHLEKLNSSTLSCSRQEQTCTCIPQSWKTGRRLYLYILVLSLGLCSSSSFGRLYGAPGWCCSVVTCDHRIYLINLRRKYFWCEVFKLTWPPGARWANINVSFPGPPPGPTMDNVAFFFLPRLEGAGITTMWDAPSPSFLSRWEWTTEDKALLKKTVVEQTQFSQNLSSVSRVSGQKYLKRIITTSYYYTTIRANLLDQILCAWLDFILYFN